MGQRYDFIQDGVRYIGSTPREPSDAMHFGYGPFDPAKAEAWATRDALAATGICIAVMLVTAPASVWLAARLWVTPADTWFDAGGKTALALIVGAALPFVYPLRWPWRAPWRAYQDTLDLCWEKYEEYHAAALDRMRGPARPAPPDKVVAVERPVVDPLDLLYRQCAVALVRARMTTARNPRTAQEKIITDVDGVTVTLDKTNYRAVAAALCELGFMAGGDGDAYTLTDEWKDSEPGELLAALKARKSRLRLRGESDD